MNTTSTITKEALKDISLINSVHLAEIDHANERVKIYCNNEGAANQVINKINAKYSSVLNEPYIFIGYAYHYVYADLV